MPLVGVISNVCCVCLIVCLNPVSWLLYSNKGFCNPARSAFHWICQTIFYLHCT